MNLIADISGNIRSVNEWNEALACAIDDRDADRVAELQDWVINALLSTEERTGMVILTTSVLELLEN